MFPSVLASLSVLTFLASPLQDDRKSDQDVFQGSWKTTSLVVNGKEIPASQYQDEIITVSGNERVLKKKDKQLAKATFTLNPASEPKSIDFTFTEGDYKGKTLKGVYKFEGELLIVNVDLGQERPTDFACEINSSRMLQKFKRIADK